MTELEELTDGRTLEQLREELKFQLETNGENPGGTIVGHIQHEIWLKEQNLKL